jgi:AcrR family transcriptional regulator
VTRTKPAGQRRAELLAAGRALFLAKGITATSLDDITQRAGVSKGLFYLYFPSKEDLVLALQEQFSHEIAARMRAAAEAEEDWAARLDACVKAGFECYRELHDLHEVLFHHARPPRRDPGALPDPEPASPPGAAPAAAVPAPGGTTPRTPPRRLPPPRHGSSRICSPRAPPRARSTWPIRKPPRYSATPACTRPTLAFAIAVGRTTPGPSTTPGSSGPRGYCSAAPPAWPERRVGAGRARAARRDAPAQSPEPPRKSRLRLHSRRPGWPIITILVPNTG